MDDLLEVLIVTVMSMLAGLLILLRKIGNRLQYVFESFEWLIIALMPTATASILFVNPISNFQWFFIPLVGGIITWFLIAILYVSRKKKIRENVSEDEEKKRMQVAVMTIISMFIALVVFTIFLYGYIPHNLNLKG